MSLDQAPNDVVYTSLEGDVVMRWCTPFRGEPSVPALDVGWRLRPDGKRERVTFRHGKWVTDEQA